MEHLLRKYVNVGTGDTMSAGFRHTARRLVLTTVTAAAALLPAMAAAQGREWTTSGYDAQRSGWVRSDPRISKAAIEEGQFTFLWKHTFDNERRQPTVLPGKFPNLICNGGQGIAVGMATNMPPHNLREICDGINYLVDHPNASLEELMNWRNL